MDKRTLFIHSVTESCCLAKKAPAACQLQVEARSSCLQPLSCPGHKGNKPLCSKSLPSAASRMPRLCASAPQITAPRPSWHCSLQVKAGLSCAHLAQDPSSGVVLDQALDYLKHLLMEPVDQNGDLYESAAKSLQGLHYYPLVGDDWTCGCACPLAAARMEHGAPTCVASEVCLPVPVALSVSVSLHS